MPVLRILEQRSAAPSLNIVRMCTDCQDPHWLSTIIRHPVLLARCYAAVATFCPARASRNRVSASGPQENNRSIADIAGMNGS